MSRFLRFRSSLVTTPTRSTLREDISSPRRACNGDLLSSSAMTPTLTERRVLRQHLTENT